MPRASRKAAQSHARAVRTDARSDAVDTASEAASARTLDVVQVNARYAPELLPGDDFLTSFVFPSNIDDFLHSNFAQKRPIAFVGGGEARVRKLLAQFMHDGDVLACAADTPSENIHVWLRQTAAAASRSADAPSLRPLIESVKVPASNADAARVCYGAGASLYFRAPPRLERALVESVCAGARMWMGAHWDHTRSQARGEVETFFSRAGHVTSFHADFQENFTLQLRGTKRWRFRGSGVSAPARGFTPHFAQQRDVAETQVKLARCIRPDFKLTAYPKEGEEVDEVELHPGDALYFPAGVWHEVVAVTDSLSINVSIANMTWADMAAAAVRQMLMSDSQWRSMICVDPLACTPAGPAPRPSDSPLLAMRGTLDGMLTRLKDVVAALRPEDLLPRAALLTPPLDPESEEDSRSGSAAEDSAPSEEEERVPASTMVAVDGLDTRLFQVDFEEDACVVRVRSLAELRSIEITAEPPSRLLRFHALAVLMKWEDASGMVDAESHDNTCSRWVVHSHFGGDEFASLCRTVVEVAAELDPCMEWVSEQHRAASSVARDVQWKKFLDDALSPCLPALQSGRKRARSAASSDADFARTVAAAVRDVLTLAGVWHSA